MRTSNQRGSHILALALLVAVVGVVGFTSYKVWDSRQNTKADTTNTTAPASIKTNKDLDDASKALDNSSADMDANLDDSGLDTDLDSML